MVSGSPVRQFRFFLVRHFYVLFLFAKGERSDLTPARVHELAKYVKELK
jgi:hypothetical protein